MGAADSGDRGNRRRRWPDAQRKHEAAEHRRCGMMAAFKRVLCRRAARDSGVIGNRLALGRGCPDDVIFPVILSSVHHVKHHPAMPKDTPSMAKNKIKRSLIGILDGGGASRERSAKKL